MFFSQTIKFVTNLHQEIAKTKPLFQLARALEDYCTAFYKNDKKNYHPGGGIFVFKKFFGGLSKMTY